MGEGMGCLPWRSGCAFCFFRELVSELPLRGGGRGMGWDGMLHPFLGCVGSEVAALFTLDVRTPSSDIGWTSLFRPV